ncbi:ribonuclease H-like domain-containing protein, partial [Halenospora varia]
AAIGVFVGRSSPYNVASILPAHRFPRRTNQVAELEAMSVALNQALWIGQDGGVDGLRLRQVVFKTDSEYVVKGLTDWAVIWEQNGYRTAIGQLVQNRELFQRLERQINELENTGVQVLFWHVLRERNRDADYLANMAM